MERGRGLLVDSSGTYFLCDECQRDGRYGLAVTMVADEALCEKHFERWNGGFVTTMRNQKFEAACRELLELHSKKNADYGTDEDPYANLRACAELGIKPWVGVTIRMRDKEERIAKAIKGGTLVNESCEDSIRDNAVYAILRYVLFKEEQDR
jgi:hypothetical protein